MLGCFARTFAGLNRWPLGSALVVCATLATGHAMAQSDKPNILVIWGDDIGQSNVSAYSRGVMGYQTPNIDRIASEGMMFTDYYAE
jgi:arylsulfatase